MTREHFAFELPDSQIARFPAAQKSQARLLYVDRKAGAIHHLKMADLPDILDERHHLVANDSAVVPSALQVEGQSIAFGREVRSGEWQALGAEDDVIHPLKAANPAAFNPALQKRIASMAAEEIWRQGAVTYPRYLKHLKKRYPQGVPAFYKTAFAQTPGSVALPSGGFNLTADLLKEMAEGGVGLSTLTLHIGHVTFKRPPPGAIDAHKMEGEAYALSAQNAQQLIAAKAEGRALIAVGTTSTRALEHIAKGGGLDPAGHHAVSDLFIRPGYEFGLVDGLITGLHGPRTTLFMLVCALGGRDLILQAYEEALSLNYRWYTLGDSMLIL